MCGFPRFSNPPSRVNPFIYLKMNQHILMIDLHLNTYYSLREYILCHCDVYLNLENEGLDEGCFGRQEWVLAIWMLMIVGLRSPTRQNYLEPRVYMYKTAVLWTLYEFTVGLQ